jgi:hypothetical protein
LAGAAEHICDLEGARIIIHAAMVRRDARLIGEVYPFDEFADVLR